MEFGKQFDTLGFDINPQRIAELAAGEDRTHEVTAAELAEAKRLRFSVEAAEFVDALYRRIITAGSPTTAPNLNRRANDANIPAP